MATSPPARHSGIVLFLVAMTGMATFDAVSKYLLQFYPAPFLNVVRYLTVSTVAVCLLIQHRRGLRDCAPKPFRLLLLARGLALGMVGTCFMTALIWMPLSEATAIYFTAPLIMVALSPWLLNESVSRVQWLTVATGFAGMLLVVRPGSNLPTLGTALMVVAAISYALMQILTRRLAGHVASDIQYASTSFICLLMTALPAPFFLPAPWPDATHALIIVSVGICNGLAQILIITALQRTSLATLAPFNYFHLIVVLAYSTFWFGRPPDALALGGMALIIAAGMLLALRR